MALQLSHYKSMQFKRYKQMHREEMEEYRESLKEWNEKMLEAGKTNLVSKTYLKKATNQSKGSKKSNKLSQSSENPSSNPPLAESSSCNQSS